MAISDLGRARAVIEGKPKSDLEKLLQDQLNKIIKDVRKRILHYNADASGKMSQNIIATKPKTSGSKTQIAITVADESFYWKFVDQGVNGTETSYGAPAWGKQPSRGLSFKDSIANWVADKGVGLPSQFDTFDQFHYAIMTNIKKHGQKPKPFYSDVVNESLVEQIKKPLEKLFGEALEIVIVEPWQ